VRSISKCRVYNAERILQGVYSIHKLCLPLIDVSVILLIRLLNVDNGIEYKDIL
jgi:hypothetical protein